MCRSEQTLKRDYSSFRVIKQEAPNTRLSLSLNENNEDNADKTDNAETTSQRLSNPDNIQILLLRNSLDIVSLLVEFTAR